MILQTGGFAFGAISTRSKFFCKAIFFASSELTIPICSPSSPISLTSLCLIMSLVGRSGLVFFLEKDFLIDHLTVNLYFNFISPWKGPVVYFFFELVYYFFQTKFAYIS